MTNARLSSYAPHFVRALAAGEVSTAPELMARFGLRESTARTAVYNLLRHRILQEAGKRGRAVVLEPTELGLALFGQHANLTPIEWQRRAGSAAEASR